MAGGGLRGLDFIEQLTLIIVNCEERGSFHCLCNTYMLYAHIKILLKALDIIMYFLKRELFHLV